MKVELSNREIFLILKSLKDSVYTCYDKSRHVSDSISKEKCLLLSEEYDELFDWFGEQWTRGLSETETLFTQTMYTAPY